jgi:hypothetical protein
LHIEFIHAQQLRERSVRAALSLFLIGNKVPIQEPNVRPTDEKKYTLVSRKPSRRGVSARDFSLPKPYRKPIPGDQLRGMSRLRLVMLAFSGLLIAALIAALAILAHENATSPHAMAIVEAAKPAPKPPPEKRAPGIKAAAAPLPTPVPAAPARIEHTLDEPPAAEPFLAAQLAEVALDDLQPDPDVVLITAILLLSAVPIAETPGSCNIAPGDEHGCSAIHAMDP